jgi:hypothetical protein
LMDIGTGVVVALEALTLELVGDEDPVTAIRMSGVARNAIIDVSRARAFARVHGTYDLVVTPELEEAVKARQMLSALQDLFLFILAGLLDEPPLNLVPIRAVVEAIEDFSLKNLRALDIILRLTMPEATDQRGSVPVTIPQPPAFVRDALDRARQRMLAEAFGGR